MASAFDERIVKVGIVIDGQETIYEGLDIRARGSKILSPILDTCEVVISNLDRETRNYLLSNATPLLIVGRERKPVIVNLYVGRASYGTFLLFSGACFASFATQPPDIGIVLRSITGSIQTGIVDGYQVTPLSSLRSICQQLARDWVDSSGESLTLDFQATEKTIANWSGTASVVERLNKLNMIGGIIASVNDKTLTVLDANKPKAGVPHLINLTTGMVGVPQVDWTGVSVKVLINNYMRLGDQVRIESQINPPASGEFRIIKMDFDVANRANPFFYNLYCSNLILIQGTN